MPQCDMPVRGDFGGGKETKNLGRKMREGGIVAWEGCFLSAAFSFFRCWQQSLAPRRYDLMNGFSPLDSDVRLSSLSLELS